MERLMQYVWEHRLWPEQEMRTVDGQRVCVVDPGRLNRDAGPDFFNAKVRIGHRMWAGNIEIHVRASDWRRHGHHTDAAYDSVILHVVDRDDDVVRRTNGEVIPQMQMPCSPHLNSDFNSLVMSADRDLPCAGEIREMPPLLLTDWLSALTYERLYARCERLDQYRQYTHGNSYEAVYILMARALGFGTNSEPFERLARSLPMRLVSRHADFPLSVEALYFGQSGLLEGVSDPYAQQLAKEYGFLRQKFGLHPMEGSSWKMARMRPPNFPHRRIALLAKLVTEYQDISSRMLEVTDLEQARALFAVQMMGYWTMRSHFDAPPRPSMQQGLSRSSVDLMVINVVVPALFDHGMRMGDHAYVERALGILEELAPERNRIIDMFARAGVNVADAGCSQALLQLRREYCEKRKCMFCRIGHRYLARKARRAGA